MSAAKKIRISKTAALRGLSAAVKKRGKDYIYPAAEKNEHGSCRYVVRRDGELAPSCIVGEVLVDLGVDPKKLFGTRLNSLSILSNSQLFERRLGIEINEEAVAILNKAQDLQDREHTWGIAVREARRLAASR